MKRGVRDRLWELVEWLAVCSPGQTLTWNPSEWNQELADEPPTGADFQATWRPEDRGDDGESIGPRVVWDPERRVVWESVEWMRQFEAQELAERKGLIFTVFPR
jgi:hypothetical protein